MYSIHELISKEIKELRDVAQSFGINDFGIIRKSDLIFNILNMQPVKIMSPKPQKRNILAPRITIIENSVSVPAASVQIAEKAYTLIRRLKRFFAFSFFFLFAVTSVLADDVIDKKIKVFPNPIDRSAIVTIEIPDNRSEMTVVVYNTVGKAIQTIKSSNNHISFTAPNVSGIYLLRFVENQKVIAVEKIVVKE